MMSISHENIFVVTQGGEIRTTDILVHISNFLPPTYFLPTSSESSIHGVSTPENGLKALYRGYFRNISPASISPNHDM